jgi:hypothetical protein
VRVNCLIQLRRPSDRLGSRTLVWFDGLLDQIRQGTLRVIHQAIDPGAVKRHAERRPFGRRQANDADPKHIPADLPPHLAFAAAAGKADFSRLNSAIACGQVNVFICLKVKKLRYVLVAGNRQSTNRHLCDYAPVFAHSRA